MPGQPKLLRCADPVSGYRQIIHRIVRAGKNGHQWFCQKERRRNRHQGNPGDHLHADRNKLFQFAVIPYETGINENVIDRIEDYIVQIEIPV